MSPIDWKNILNGSVIVLLSPVGLFFFFCFFVYPVLILKGKLKMKMTPLPMQF